MAAIPDDIRVRLATGLADSVCQCWPEATAADLGAIAAVFAERMATRSGDPAGVLAATVEPLKLFIRMGLDLRDAGQTVSAIQIHTPSDATPPTTPAFDKAGTG